MRFNSLLWLSLTFWTGSGLLTTCLSAQETVPSAPKNRPAWYMGRQIAPTMSVSGAEWLTRKSRETEEQPRKLMQALQLKPKQQVCDFGCGNGYYTLQLAKQVGPRGKVFAVDIQQEMLTLLQQRAEPRGLSNIESVLATLTDSKLPQRKLDLVLMVDVYHELSDPATILDSVHASLNPAGRLALVEFREEDPEVPILPLHKMSQAQVMKEITASQFKLVGQYDDLPWQHVFFFARQDSHLERKQLSAWQSEKSPQSILPKAPVDIGF